MYEFPIYFRIKPKNVYSYWYGPDFTLFRNVLEKRHVSK